MNREYLKNLFLQEIGRDDYLAVFRDSISKVVSLELINAAIAQAIAIGTEEQFNDLLALFLLHIELNPLFHEKFCRSDFNAFLLSKPLTGQSYEKVRCIYEKASVEPPAVKREHREFFRKNFYNHHLYRVFFTGCTFDPDMGVGILGSAELRLFKGHLKHVCIGNRENEELLRYIDTLPIDDKDYYKAIVSPRYQVGEGMLAMGDNYIFYPSQTRGVAILEFLRPFLCYLNSGITGCRICGKKTLVLEGWRADMERLLHGRSWWHADDLCFVMMHYPPGRSRGMLKALLKLLFEKDCTSERFAALGHFELRECSKEEDMVVEVLKSVSISEREHDFRAALRMFPYLQFTKKILFSYFVVLYEGFLKYESPFVRDVIRNIVVRNKSRFFRVRGMIFEYYANGLSAEGEEVVKRMKACENKENMDAGECPVPPEYGFESRFKPLASFFDEDYRSFVENNMFYIYPLAYSVPALSCHFSDPSFTRKNNHYLVIALFLRGEEQKIEEMGYTQAELSRMGVEVLVPLFFNNYFNYERLSRYFGDVRRYISTNLSKFLFVLKSVYTERPFELGACVFKVLRQAMDAISSDIEVLFNYLFPFIEFFMSRNNSKCSDRCKNVFIEYFLSRFEDKCFVRNMSRIFPYLDTKKILELTDADEETKCLEAIDALLENKGYFAQHIAAEKAIRLLKTMLIRTGESQSLGGGTAECRTTPADEFDEEYFVRCLLTLFFKNHGLRLKLAYVFRKLQQSDNEMRALIGCISPRFLKLGSSADRHEVPVVLGTTESIAKAMIKQYLLEIDPRKQDLHFFVIQEALKFIKGPLDEKTENIVEQFRKTQYSYKHSTAGPKGRLYEKTHKYKRFLENVFHHTLCEMEHVVEDHFRLLQYGNLFEIQFLEFNCLCLARLALEHGRGHDLLDMVKEVVGDLEEGVDKRICRFILRLHKFTEERFICSKDALRISYHLRDHYRSIQILEAMIREQRSRELFDMLQYCYYSIRDYEKTKGINTSFTRLTSVNLFFEFCMGKNYAAARKVLDSRTLYIDSAAHHTSTQDVADILPSPEDTALSINTLLSDLLEGFEDEEISKFLEDCRAIEKDFGEWRSLSSKSEICQHFIKDCELISKSRDLLVTLDLVAGRRELSDNNPILLECHRLLVPGLKEMFSKAEMPKATVPPTLSLGGVQDRIPYSDENHSVAVGRYASIDEFERDLSLTAIQGHRREGDYSKCIREIGNMLLKKEWCVFYELAKLHTAQGNVRDAKVCLKKVLSLFPKTSVFYRKALIKHAELVDTKSGYKEALGALSNSASLFLLSAKKFEGTESTKAMEYYIKCVGCSGRYLDEAIPRIFHLFSELATAREIKAGCELMDVLREENLSVLPPFYSQIISRLSHSNSEVSAGISKVVFELMERYPGETFWKSLSTINSQTAETRKRAEGVTSALSFENKVLLSNVKKIAEQLTLIAKSKKKELSMENDFPALVRLLPIGVSIPNTRTTIHGVEEGISIFCSLQCPKRICFVGADGKQYYWLCKYQDDLRKDSRFMDLNVIINNMFKRQNMSKYIRTYTVIPFSHCSGMIEWIDGLSSLKAICSSYYSSNEISISNMAKKYTSKRKIGPGDWAAVVGRFPPVFHRWFHDSFPQPLSWFSARNSYTSTCAVMNIVGWFMGLGDRHAENILFDVHTGDTVHVDLNCIFGRGRELDIPERVPFRLTQNIADAFGVIGLEGTYNAACCATLDLFLRNRNVLISNLLSFVYDPLFEWKKKTASTPKKIIDELCSKLEDLDVTSKVDALNEEACSDGNLCMMYIGWLPFI
jgi:serine/threonine-protein kinase ATR